MKTEELDKLQAEIKSLTAKYLKTVEVAGYEDKLDYLVEDVWLEFLCKPVSEACEEAMDG